MKSCYDLINEFNAVATAIPVEVRDAIYNDQPVPMDTPKVREAVKIWRGIQERLNLIPQYDLMVQ